MKTLTEIKSNLTTKQNLPLEKSTAIKGGAVKDDKRRIRQKGITG